MSGFEPIKIVICFFKAIETSEIGALHEAEGIFVCLVTFFFTDEAMEVFQAEIIQGRRVA